MLLLVVLQNAFEFDITVALVAVYLFNSMSMLVPFAMPQLIRARAESVIAILLVGDSIHR